MGIYSGWTREARARGDLVVAEKLGDTETWVVGDSATARTVGAGAAPGVLTGIFIVRAPDEAAALDLARSTPHYRFGGIVLVRPVDPT